MNFKSNSRPLTSKTKNQIRSTLYYTRKPETRIMTSPSRNLALGGGGLFPFSAGSDPSFQSKPKTHSQLREVTQEYFEGSRPIENERTLDQIESPNF